MNRLADTASPYLLQHKDNPVDWWPWGEAAFAEAKRTGKPVLLSVGYAACHWCHVMAHESFEDPATAAVMNELFVNIKVDREERPDVDQVYMAALHALGQQGGWPLTMFLTADGEPVWGGTYFPPEQRFGRPAFRDVLAQVADVFRTEPDRIRQNRQALVAHLQSQRPPRGKGGLGRAELDEAAARILRIMDPVRGGIGGAPKFPNAPVLELLWRGAARGGGAAMRESVLTALRQMARGGIHDHVGGGFARYSVDHRWLVPHFEKMLYDNAQLLELLSLAWQATGEPIFERAATGIVDWLSREMVLPGGAFAASLDADSEGEEGRFYVWTPEQVSDALLPEEAALVLRLYDISPGGNWEGVSIPNRLSGVVGTDEEEAALPGLLAKLRLAREQRVRPGLDDKVLADWNGLMIAALVRAAVIFGRPDWLALAQRAFRFVAETMSRGDRLGHAWREGRLVFPGFASDNGAMARAAVTLAEATGDRTYLDLAGRWLRAADRDYADPHGTGYATTAADAGGLPVRPHPTGDDAMPNANALLAEAWLGLGILGGDEAARQRADSLLAGLSAAMASNAAGHAALMNVLDRRLHGAEIVIVGEGEAADDLAGEALLVPFPFRSVLRAATPGDLPTGHPVRNAAGVDAAAFICRGDTCSRPVREPDALWASLGGEDVSRETGEPP